MEADLPVLTGFVISPKKRMVYGWKSSATGVKTNREDTVLLSGIVNPLYSADLSDDSAVELLKDLAGFIGERLNQTRMYIEYMDTVVITQNGQATHPTEKKIWLKARDHHSNNWDSKFWMGELIDEKLMALLS